MEKITRREFLELAGLAVAGFALSSCDKNRAPSPVQWTRTDVFPGYEAKKDIEGTDRDGTVCEIQANSQVTVEDHVTEGGSGPDLSMESIVYDSNGCTKSIRTSFLKNPLRQIMRLVRKSN